MGLDIHHYVGYYFKCEKGDVNPYLLFPEEEFCRAYDENGNDDINDGYIFICNTSRILGHILLSDDATGLRDLPDRMFPKEFQETLTKLKTVYAKVEVCFGVVSYSM